MTRMVHSRGFTLVEVLVVMSLLSLVMLALGSALRTTAQTEERVDQRLARTDEIRVASDFLRGVMGRISAQKLAGPVAAGENSLFFRGAGEEMIWVGVMPARYGAGGRYFFKLALEGRPAGRALVLRFIPWSGADVPLDWARAESYDLVAGVAAFALQYEDAGVEPPAWSRQWSAPEGLPRHVLLSLRTASGVWPDLLVAMRAMPTLDPSASGGEAVFGGAR